MTRNIAASVVALLQSVRVALASGIDRSGAERTQGPQAANEGSVVADLYEGDIDAEASGVRSAQGLRAGDDGTSLKRLSESFTLLLFGVTLLLLVRRRRNRPPAAPSA